jgi:hypothetical protein
MVLRKWLQTTPAGAAALKVLSPAVFYAPSAQPPNSPSFWLVAGDTGGCDMHDGHHFPLGIESRFLDSLAQRSDTTVRYHRCAACPDCSDCPGSTWAATRVGLLWSLGRRLLQGQAYEAAMPKVVSAVSVAAHTSTRDHPGAAAGSSFTVSAAVSASVSVAAAAAGESQSSVVATLWYSPSRTRVYNDPGRKPWTGVRMEVAAAAVVSPGPAGHTAEASGPDPGGGGQQAARQRAGALTGGQLHFRSPPIAIPAGEEVAWYVNAQVPIPLLRHKRSVNVSDSSPIRIENAAAADTCPVPATKFCD